MGVSCSTLAESGANVAALVAGEEEASTEGG